MKHGIDRGFRFVSLLGLCTEHEKGFGSKVKGIFAFIVMSKIFLQEALTTTAELMG
jgi:hypothetical protein